MILERVVGHSERKDVWWHCGGHAGVSCPKCGYVTTWGVAWKPIPMDGVLNCRGCGKTSDIELR